MDDKNKKRKINASSLNPRKDKILFYIIFAIIFSYIIYHLSNVFDVFIDFISLASPFYVALVIAFILNIPMRAYERLIRKIFYEIKKEGPAQADHSWPGHCGHPLNFSFNHYLIYKYHCAAYRLKFFYDHQQS